MADPNAAQETVVTHDLDPLQPEALGEYWTEAAMREARPIGVDVEPGDGIETLTEAHWAPVAEAVSAESRPADGEALPDLDDLESPGDFNTERVSRRDVPPYATVGKLFMVFGGENYVGTAWVVAEKAVFTAGHCVYDRSAGWAQKLLFVPRYNDGDEPVGRWSATRIHTLRGWVDHEDFKYDMASFVTDRAIRPRTGSLGWMAHLPPNQAPYDSIGYPAASAPGFGFDGRRMWHCVGRHISGSNPVKMHNNMTGGCSGGPWAIIRDGRAYANGLNSFRYTIEPRTLQSPYFGQGFVNLYDAVKNER